MKLRHLIALLIILVPSVLYYLYYRWAGKALSPEELTTIGVILLIVSTWVGFAKNLIDLWRKLTGREIPPPRPLDFPFAIVREPDKVLTTLFGESPNPLADDKLDYQVRQEGHDTTAELRELLESKRQVLLRSVSGVGKTREIGELARQLVEEEYTLLVHDKHDRLLTPVRFPPEMPARNLLFVFDDLHTPCAPVQEGAGGTEGLSGRESFHDRLQRFLDQAVAQFGSREVNVLAAARSEREHWPHLLWGNHPVWSGVHRYDLPAPEEEAQARFLRNVAERGQVEVPAGDVERIAHDNDRTFRNLLENVRRARAAGELTAQTFLPHQGRTFEQTYTELRKAHPRLIPRLWDALHLLRSSGLPMQSNLTANLAARLDTPGLLRLLTQRRLLSLIADLVADGHLARAAETGDMTVQEELLTQRRLLSLIADLVADGHLARAAETGDMTVQEELLAAKPDWPDPVQHFDDLWAAVQGLGPAALSLWYRLASYANSRGHAAVAERICRAILRQEREHMGALNLLGVAARWLGRLQESALYLERVRVLARQQGDKEAEGIALGNLGNCCVALGQAKRAIVYSQQALSITREIGDRRHEGIWIGNLGNAYLLLGRVEQAIEYHRQALSISREVDDRPHEGTWLGHLGLAYADLGQVQWAIGYYEQALAISQEIRDRRGEGTWLGHLGKAYADLGQLEQAVEYTQQALTINREIGDRWGEGNQLSILGVAYYRLGQVKQTIEYSAQALQIAREIGDRHMEANALDNLGNAYAGLGQVERAIEYYEQALDISREIGDPRGEGNHLGNLGLAYAALGQVERAIEHYQQALSIAREVANRWDEGTWLGNLGLAYLGLGQVERTIEHTQQALGIAREIGDRCGEARHLANLGRAYRRQEQPEKAGKLWLEALRIFEEIKSPQAETVRGWLEEIANDQ